MICNKQFNRIRITKMGNQEPEYVHTNKIRGMCVWQNRPTIPVLPTSSRAYGCLPTPWKGQFHFTSGVCCHNCPVGVTSWGDRFLPPFHTPGSASRPPAHTDDHRGQSGFFAAPWRVASSAFTASLHPQVLLFTMLTCPGRWRTMQYRGPVPFSTTEKVYSKTEHIYRGLANWVQIKRAS